MVMIRWTTWLSPDLLGCSVAHSAIQGQLHPLLLLWSNPFPADMVVVTDSKQDQAPHKDRNPCPPAFVLPPHEEQELPAAQQGQSVAENL